MEGWVGQVEGTHAGRSAWPRPLQCAASGWRAERSRGALPPRRRTCRQLAWPAAHSHARSLPPPLRDCHADACQMDLEVVTEARCSAEEAALQPTNAARNRAMRLVATEVGLRHGAGRRSTGAVRAWHSPPGDATLFEHWAGRLGGGVLARRLLKVLLSQGCPPTQHGRPCCFWTSISCRRLLWWHAGARQGGGRVPTGVRSRGAERWGVCNRWRRRERAFRARWGPMQRLVTLPVKAPPQPRRMSPGTPPPRRAQVPAAAGGADPAGIPDGRAAGHGRGASSGGGWVWGDALVATVDSFGAAVPRWPASQTVGGGARTCGSQHNQPGLPALPRRPQAPASRRCWRSWTLARWCPSTRGSFPRATRPQTTAGGPLPAT